MSLKLIVADILLKRTLFILLLVIAVSSYSQQNEDALELYRNGDFERAVEVTVYELSQEPRNMDSYVVLGWSLIGLGRYKEALEYASRGLKIAEYDHRLIEIEGEALFYEGELEGALERFERYVALAPEGGRIEKVYYFMGEIYIRIKEYNNADIAFSTALYFLPDSKTWWARLGYARELGGNNKLALVAYQKAINLDRSFVDAARGIERVEKLINY